MALEMPQTYLRDAITLSHGRCNGRHTQSWPSSSASDTEAMASAHLSLVDPSARRLPQQDSTEQQQQLSWAQFDCCVPPEGPLTLLDLDEQEIGHQDDEYMANTLKCIDTSGACELPLLTAIEDPCRYLDEQTYHGHRTGPLLPLENNSESIGRNDGFTLRMMPDTDELQLQPLPRRRVGRPRLETKLVMKHQAGADGHAAKRTRGPKPKYVFSSVEEAANARRERNRRSALNSYYKKRQKVQELEAECARLMHENSALQELLLLVKAQGGAALSTPSMEGVDEWLRMRDSNL